MSDCADLLLAVAQRRLAADDRHGALVLLEELLRVQPDHVAALRLAAEQQAISNPAGALALVQRILQHDPDDSEAQGLRARITSVMGRHDEAAHHFYALALARPDALALTNYAVSLLRAGDPHAAVDTAQRALALAPAQAEAHAALGHAHNVLHQPEQAIGAFETALRLRPDFADALLGLARAYRERGAPSLAIAALLRAARIAPHLVGPHVELTTLYREFLQPDAADAAMRQAFALSPVRPYFASNRLLFMQYDPAVDEAAAAAAARSWGLEQIAAVAATPVAADRDRDPDRRLRIGYVSADLYCHPVGWLGSAPIIAHDRRAVSVFIYANQRSGDPLTERLQRAADAWLPIIGLDDESVAARIAADRIDILVDLSGHTAGNRLGVFARRPAPIQVSWLGYSATTGLPTMDYVLFDDHHIGADAEDMMLEQVVRLPHVRFCYSPPGGAPLLPDPPARDAPPVFCSFNYTAKLNDRVIALWSRVLAAVPESRLLLKSRGLTDQLLQSAIRRKFIDCRVDGSRILFDGHSGHADMLLQYGAVDVALDQFPFCGGVTSCEALWMGVPVVTLPGRRPFSRQTHAILHAIGRPEWSAAGEDEYVSIAAGLIAEPIARSALRRQVQESPLCDASGFARRLERVFRAFWTAHLAGPGRVDFLDFV